MVSRNGEHLQEKRPRGTIIFRATHRASILYIGGNDKEPDVRLYRHDNLCWIAVRPRVPQQYSRVSSSTQILEQATEEITQQIKCKSIEGQTNSLAQELIHPPNHEDHNNFAKSSRYGFVDLV